MNNMDILSPVSHQQINDDDWTNIPSVHLTDSEEICACHDDDVLIGICVGGNFVMTSH